jgi:hypothetical protein
MLRVRKMAMAAGVIALVVAGCGSTAAGTSSGGPTGQPPAAAKEGPTGLKIKECQGCAGSAGSTATVPYASETASGSKENTTLEVTAISVEKGTLADLKDFELDAEAKAAEPYYVKTKFRNAGDKPVGSGTLFTTILALNAPGDQLATQQRPGDFAKCQGDATGTLAPGAEYNDCQIFMAPAGKTVTEVGYLAYGGTEIVNVTWTLG